MRECGVSWFRAVGPRAEAYVVHLHKSERAAAVSRNSPKRVGVARSIAPV